ncbi:MAG: DUF5320 domain-containing protein [Clostridiales bacterium]|nr:DUF5320 domain-containing protein [Clostridiales bacterium]MCF8022255.1 DUF5320 domain-containing protein [Clostridiales bacterium]
MPGGDRRGPIGEGPRTGRGAGFCSGNSSPGFMNRFFSGRRRRFANNVPPRSRQQYSDEDFDVTDQLSSLREQLDTIQQKIKKIEDK